MPVRIHGCISGLLAAFAARLILISRRIILNAAQLQDGNFEFDELTKVEAPAFAFFHPASAISTARSVLVPSTQEHQASATRTPPPQRNSTRRCGMRMRPQAPEDRVINALLVLSDCAWRTARGAYSPRPHRIASHLISSHLVPHPSRPLKVRM